MKWRGPRPGGRWLFALSISLLMVFAEGCKVEAPAPSIPEVQFVTVGPADVPIFEEWIGTLDGFVNAQIHAQVTGYLLAQNYLEGKSVKKGDPLFQIDPRPFEAILHQAQAKLAQDQAQADKTELDVKRDTQLSKEHVVSQEVFDDATQANLMAEAQVKAGEAAMETTRLNCEFTHITSPVDGLAGMALAQIGDLVGPSSSLLTTVSSLNPIKVYFQISEQSYLDFWQHQAADGRDEPDAQLQLIFADGSVYPQKGKFFFADRQVNPTTGTLQVVGLFPNPGFVLRPGQYGRVRVQTQIKKNALLIPQRAVSELQGKYQVAVVTPDNKIQIRAVALGTREGESWVVTSGLKVGEHVVSEGVAKVRDGMPVTPKPDSYKSNGA